MRQKIQNIYFNQENIVVQYDNHITFSVIMLVILVFSYVQISAQDGNQSKINNKSITDKINSTAVTGDVINFKDESNNLLIKITDEGNAGSIELPNVGIILSGNKLYNNGGNLFWGNSAIGSGGAADINSLSDGKFDGSSLFLGNGAGDNDAGNNFNTGIGERVLFLNLTGNRNTAIGYRSLYSNTIGSNNTVSGNRALYSNTSGFNNTTIGYRAMYFNETGDSNTANGYQALYSNVAGNNGVAIGFESQKFSFNSTSSFENTNTSVGFQSLRGSTNPSVNLGINNSSFGYQTLLSNSYGSNNTAIGFKVLFYNTGGDKNTANGFQSLYSNTFGSNNTANGYEVLYFNTTGNENTATGLQALYANTTGSKNTANGFNALFSNTTGENNTADGYGALQLNTTGGSNTAIGKWALFGNSTGSSNTAGGISSLGNNQTGWGNTAFGTFSLINNTIGVLNTAIGQNALFSNIVGNRNVSIGSSSNFYNGGSFNTIVGFEAGKGTASHSKDGCVFIGYQAGFNETNDNRLYIENSNADSALIWGNFNNRRVVINGNGDDGNTTFTFYVNGKSGGSTPWNNLSDVRLKKNVTTITNALGKVKKIRGVNYEWKDTEKYDEGPQIGFIAQEVNKIIPEVVDDSGEFYSMQYAPITALLVEAIKDQQKIIENLKTQNSELETRLSKIENYLKGESLVNIDN